jgi:DNA-directed RNA polymerase subunit beta'
MLKGKQGRFRQNLLGKRVDYSGRSVIVVGPELKLHQCGLPKKMALELFKPFIYNKLESYGFASTLKSARKMVESERPEVWDILDEVIREHPILLNRAPTLHRLGIQAFEPILIEGKAIQLHPLVCTAFNADFDGDQMAVHIPLSLEAQLEARVLMMSTNNILSPSSGKPIIVPSQDIVLGIYYLSLINDNEEVKKYFSHIGEVEFALENKSISLHTPIIYRTKTFNKETNEYEDKKFTTSPGRVILFKTVPQSENLPFDCVNKILTKKDVSNLLDNVYRFTGQKATCIFVDQIMNVGFKYAAKAGISFGKDDLVIPEEKNSLIQETQKQVNSLEAQYQEGLITEREKYNKVVGLWSICTDKVAKAMMKTVSTSKDNQINSVYIMAHSGARGSEAQLKQLAGMRGLMARPSGEIIENPITSNFKDGLTVLEYFNSTHGARKGLADTALKTASSGYLTRRLVDVAQDLTITQKDCSCSNGLTVDTVYESGEVAIPLKDRVFGRYLADDVKTPEGKVIMKNGEYISHEEIETIEKENITSVRIKSPITCGCVNGICAKAYGRDLAKGEPVNTGEAVGIIAAQSIGEPGTQLTMRTFHVGGVASSSAEKSNFESPSDGKIKIQNLRSVINQAGSEIIINRTTELEIYDLNNKLVSTFRAPYGSTLLVKNKAEVKLNELLLEWDPYTVPIVAEESGTLDFSDLVEGVSFIEKFDETTGISSKVIIDWKSFQGKQDLKPQLVIIDDKGNPVKSKGSNNSSYDLSVGIVLNIEKGKEVKAGDIIARIPRASSKTKDITGGLPRVADIFESRKPKNPAVLAEVSGVIEFGKDIKSKRRIIINPEEGDPIEYLIPKGTYIYFNEGDKVNKGDMIVDGTPAPSDILNILGIEALAEYMVREVQKVYRLQGVIIDDKHIECITKQMLQKVEVIDSGDSEFPVGDVLDKTDVLQKNIELKEAGKNEAKFKMMILGITKASLQTNSFISAASFQETTRVLTEAAINGKVDKLTGLKENVIVGKLIPAGTGNVIRALKKEAKIRDNSILKQIENSN